MAKVKEEVAVAAEVTKVAKKEKPGLNKNKQVTVDTPFEDVLKWDQDGYNLKFSDDERNFKELNGAELKQLSVYAKDSYYVAQALLRGIDVGMIEKGYDTTPGAASDRLKIFGQKDDRVYSWQTPETLQRAAQKGYKVDTDPDVTNWLGETGVKTVGGKRNTELVLSSARKSDIEADKARRKAKRDLAMTRNTEAYMEAIEKLGGQGHVEPFDK